MITQRIYLIGLPLEIADMLLYDEDVENDYFTLEQIARMPQGEYNRVMAPEKTLIIRADDFDSIPKDLREESVFVLQHNINKPDFDPLVVFEFNTDLYKRAGVGYVQLYFDDMFGIELKPEAVTLGSESLALNENTVC